MLSLSTAIEKSGTSLGERLTSLSLVVAIHIGLMLLLLAVRGPAQAAPAKGGALSIVSLTAPQPAQSLPPPPTMPSKRIDEAVPLASFIYSDTFDRDAQLPAAGDCSTLDLVVKSLLADRPAVESILGLPPEERSVADAVVIWNAGWSQAATTPEAPLARARASVEQSLATVSARCLDEPVAGPRLVPIPAGEGTMFLVFGSGVWTWRDLIKPSDPVASLQMEESDSNFAVTLRRLFGN